MFNKSTSEAPQNSGDAEKDVSKVESTPIRFLTWRTFVLAIVASMGGFIFGYGTGQIAGFTTMDNFKERFAQYNTSTGEYYFSNVRNGLIVGLLSIGTMIGALVAAPIADRYGRKYSISFWSVINIIGNIIQIVATDKWYQIAIGRWVAGLGIGGLSSVVPMYQGEASPRHIRGAIVSCFQLFVAFGIFISYCVNCGTESIDSAASWRITVAIGFIWAFILGVGILFLPESPRYAFRCGREDEATEIMAMLYGVSTNHEVIIAEVKDMREKLDEEREAGTATWIECFTGPRMAYRTCLGLALQSLQQLTGANFIFYYGNTIFQSTGFSNSYITQIILGGVNFFVTFPGLYIIEHYGRRKCLIWGSITMFISFLIWASLGHFSLDRANPQNTPGIGGALIAFTCIFIIGFATTWGPIVWAICSEMYPARYRATCIGMATASNWLWNFLISFFTPFINSAIDFRYGYVFSACCLLSVFVVYFGVCESQGRSLEEVDTMYVMHVAPWKSSTWVAPVRAAEEPAEDKQVSVEERGNL